MLKKIELFTPAGESLTNITAEIEQLIREAGATEGLCILIIPHTTAGLTINSGLDSNTFKDIVEEFHRLVPTRVDFNHTYDTPADAAGHIKSVLVGQNLSLIITDGKLMLGHAQSILFCEFDGPRKREVWLRIMSDT